MAQFITLSNGIPLLATEAAGVTIYDETTTIGATITTGTPITLPLSRTYDDNELEVWLNMIRQPDVSNFTFVGAIPRTQIAFTFDLIVGDKLRFRIDRASDN